VEPPARVFYKGIQYRRYPDSPHRSHRVYYQRRVQGGIEYLHRDIWRDNHPGEEIPAGWHVHHDDEDPFNNEPSNLVLLSPAEHSEVHPGDQSWEEENLLDHLDRIRPLAAEWHRSEAGHDWHVEHGKATWETRQRFAPRPCEVCGTDFEPWWPAAKWCSDRCQNRARAKNPKYLETVTCPVCGSEFQRDKYHPGRKRTCSRKCGAQLRKKRAA
jgi:predicted nucleic acid-binding Zn ribbon protein